MMGHIQHLSFESLFKMDHFQKEPPLNLKGTTGAKGSEIPVRLNVRFGSKADMCSAIGDVRYVPIADIARPIRSTRVLPTLHCCQRDLSLPTAYAAFPIAVS